MSEVPYQSLYRRYRPQRFDEMAGQDHVVMALRNAVRDAKVAHAYLFSGPRGTGKTSAARILAKALNCANPVDGEPDATCESCLRIQAGNSMDVHELDAASNNGVDAMRDLTGRAALGTPGRWKVYIVDEVHMLSTAASNALLKTLEEPPSHVVFVLATTDPQKVLPTIRSRTQHFEFRLLAPELLVQLVTDINNKANLHVPGEALDLVVRRGKGSARDALSALDQVAAAGAIEDDNDAIDEMVEAMCERDTGRALVAVAEACNSGREAQRLAVDLLEYMRNGFLSLMAKGLVSLPDTAVERIEEQARRLGAPALVRSMEGIGQALLDMRDAPETRVTLEVALVRLTKPELSADPEMLLERIERLERGAVANATSTAQPAEVTPPAPAPSAPMPETPKQTPPASPRAAGERPSLGGLRSKAQPSEPKAPAPQPKAPEAQPEAAPEPPQAQAQPEASGTMPTRDQITEAWGDSILESLVPKARSRFRSGRFVDVENGKAVFALPNSIHRDRCEEVRREVEVALGQHFSVRMPLELIVEGDSGAAGAQAQSAPEPEEEVIDIRDTVVADSGDSDSPEDRLLKAFPGAQEMN